MTRWEYELIELPQGWTTTAKPEKWQKILNELGFQGWELTSVVVTTTTGMSFGSKTDKIVAILKRACG